MRKPQIVTFGGGAGAPVIIRSLILAGFNQISAISASMDSGGKTGFIRSDERDRVIAISDLLRNLLALIDTKDSDRTHVNAFMDLASFTDGRNRNLGYTIYYALLEKYQNDFYKVQAHLESLLGIKFRGKGIPVTLEPTNIYFKTDHGPIYRGEHELDRQSMSSNRVTKIWVNPEVHATDDAVTAIRNATHIIYCPGSLYGSIISNLLPKGISEALKQSNAHKILITNLESNRNQTHLFTPEKYLKIFQEYTHDSLPFHTIITPDISRKKFDQNYPLVAKNYASEHAHFLGWEPANLSTFSNKYNIQIISSNIYSVTPHLNRLRHEPQKLAPLLKKIITTKN